MWVPPILVRRVIFDPIVFVCASIGVLISPVLFAGAVIADLFVAGSWRVVRMTRLAVVFMACEVIGLLSAFALWTAALFGTRIRSPLSVHLHYRLLGWWVRIMARELQIALGLRVVTPDIGPVDGPVLIFSRHAGPGDSIFLANALISDFDRLPRIVGKKELEFSPFFDILGHRLPMRFIRPHAKKRYQSLDAIRYAASGLGDRDAFVLFPEGGNFTPRRRQRAIEQLERTGLSNRAERARSLVNVLPPHPAGPNLAMDLAPDADVVFVAHTGSDELISMEAIWRGMPFHRSIEASAWRVPSAEIPTDHEARTAWLLDQWDRVDRWISENRASGAMP